MGGGSGGGSTSITPISPGQLDPFYNFQQGQYNNFVSNNPLLSTANTGALGFYNNLGSLTNPLSSLESQAPGFYSGLQNEVGGIQSQVPALQQNLQGIYGGLGGLIGQVPGLQGQLSGLNQKVGALASPFGQYLGPNSALSGALSNTVNPVLQSGGALTQDQSNQAIQQARAAASASGSVHDPSAIISEYENQQNAKDARFNQALGQSQGILGQQSGATGALQNIYNQQSGITGEQGNLLSLAGNLYGQQGQNVGEQQGLLGLMSALTGQKGGLFQQQAGVTGQLSQGQQGLQTGGLNQLLGTLTSGVSAFTGLQNPMVGLVADNLQARIAQAQIAAQQQAASSAKSGGLASGGISAVASILPMLAAFSDERVKSKIEGTGLKNAEGVPIKTWEYKTNPGTRFLGAMAQDIEKVAPESVFTDPRSGLKIVDAVRFPITRISALTSTRKAA